MNDTELFALFDIEYDEEREEVIRKADMEHSIPATAPWLPTASPIVSRVVGTPTFDINPWVERDPSYYRVTAPVMTREGYQHERDRIAAINERKARRHR